MTEAAMLHTILHVLAVLLGLAPPPAFMMVPGLEGASGAWMPAAMMGASLVSGWLGNRKSREEKAAAAALQRAQGQASSNAQLYGGYADASRGNWLNSINSFDPSSYLTGETQAVSADITDALGQGDAARRSQMSSRGFYGGGIGTGALNRTIGSYAGREAARLSTTAGNMQMQKMGMWGQLYGMDANRANQAEQNSYDLAAGNRDYEAQGRQAKNATWQNAIGTGGMMYGASKGWFR